MKKNKFSTKIMAFLLGVVLLLAPSFAQGQRGSGQPGAQNQAPAPLTISDDNRTWGGIPYIAGGLLAAGIVAIGFKNSKKTHLD